jgi:hypothetical protein
MHVERSENGGFPEPIAGEPVRLVRCRHDACGTATRVRVPRALPARAVRRVVCEQCRRPFECEDALDAGVMEAAAAGGGAGSGAATEAPAAQRPSRRAAVRRWVSDPESHAWRYLSIPVAVAAVIVGLILIQGSGGSDQPSSPPAASEAAPSGSGTAAGGDGQAAGHGGAEVVKGSSYTLAMPPAWTQTEPENGATFAAAADGGGATAKLWIQRDPKLSFPQFEAQSLAQLRGVAGNAHVEDRTAAPTADGTIVTLAADAPQGAPAYEATLRVTGPYRYYLATTVDPDASRTAVDGAELIRNSFVPVATTGKTG